MSWKEIKMSIENPVREREVNKAGMVVVGGGQRKPEPQALKWKL